jgi:hypothetical protein
MVYIAQWPSFYMDWELWRVVRNYVLEAVPCQLCHAVVAICPGNRNEFLRRYPGLGKRLHHIPTSIDLSSVPSHDRSAKLSQPSSSAEPSFVELDEIDVLKTLQNSQQVFHQ